jgi:hypothetical protein
MVEFVGWKWHCPAPSVPLDTSQDVTWTRPSMWPTGNFITLLSHISKSYEGQAWPGLWQSAFKSGRITLLPAAFHHIRASHPGLEVRHAPPLRYCYPGGAANRLSS